MVNAIAHIDVKTPWLTEERFVAWGAAAEAVAGGVVLGIRLGFHHHAPQQAAVLLAFHQPATNQVGGDQLGGAGEEGLGERWEALGGRGGDGNYNKLKVMRTKKEKPTMAARKIQKTLKVAFSAAWATGTWLTCLATPAHAQMNTCYSARDEAQPSYIKCEVRFVNGSIFSIKDLSDGYTFRIGENGWIPVPGKNCISNIESGSTFCLSN